LIDGGVAPNVISPHAWAEVLFRSVGPPEEILSAVADLEPLVSVQEVLRVPTVRLRTVPELPSQVFPFTTDVPLLDRWGEPLLFGPGSFLVAHTDGEHMAIDEMEAAVGTYEKLVEHCLTSV
jgi:acetylornithine deacetylase